MHMEEAGIINGKSEQLRLSEAQKEALHDLALAPAILEFYINYIAQYEYKKLDNVQSTTRFGGMENRLHLWWRRPRWHKNLKD